MRRRYFLSLLILSLSFAGDLFSQPISSNLIAWWKFESITNDVVQETISGENSNLYGFKKLINGVNGEGLLFDGYNTYVESKSSIASKITNAFTIEGWIAIQAYPWNWVPIVEQQDSKSGFSLSIDANGHLRLQAVLNGKLESVQSAEKISLLKWTFITGTFKQGSGLAIYINGEEINTLAATGNFTQSTGSTLIGKSVNKLPPAYPIRLDIPVAYTFDGIIDEVKIFRSALDAQQIKSHFSRTKPENDFGLKYRKLPVGPEGPGRFGAYYTKLKFSETWDATWRVGPYADVVVRFDDASYKFVFWRGTSYIPCWVTENGIWYTNEFNETWGEDVLGCAEPMSDKQTIHSHVRIIESSDARVVVHWRYALVDNRGVIAKYDPISKWGDWSDEYYTIYPDGVGLRKIHLWSSEPTRPHQFQESIILNPPGTKPEDNINTDAIIMANMKGETHTYSWAEKAPDVIDKPEKANIEFINLKSKYKPFVIVNEGKPSVTRNNIKTDGPWLKPYNGEINRKYSIFPWWNHWPVAQIESDGRWATEPDRVSHTSLSNDLEWKELALTKNSHVRVMMHGLTNQSPAELTALAKSWLYPPELVLESNGFNFEGYKEEERAFVLSAEITSQPGTLKYKLNASPESPVKNPAFIIKNWGDSGAKLILNGEEIPRGKKFRYGMRYTLESSDLICWLKYETVQPVEIEIQKNQK